MVAATCTCKSTAKGGRHELLLMKPQHIRLPIGTRVRSTYRARWFGVVVAHVGLRGVTVRITHDRTGRPIVKPNSARALRTYDGAWFDIV